MIRLEKVNAKNVWDLLELKVSPEQKGFVADNTTSIIEAYTTVTAGGHAFPFGIYDGAEPVGFLMVGYGTDDYWEDAPKIAYDNYSLWRLMIDSSYQGNGYGKEAVRLALAFIRTFPCGPADFCYVSYEPENTLARDLYRSVGFVENGEMDGDEIVAILKL